MVDQGEARGGQAIPEEVVVGYFESMSRWGEWGAADERGSLNLIGHEQVLTAYRTVEFGMRVSCGRPVEFAPVPPSSEAPVPPVHFMRMAGETAPSGAMAVASDWAGLPLHGLYLTHLDAPSHVFWDGHLYNGRPAHEVTTGRGALVGSVSLAAEGIVTRGVLLDIPPVRGVDSLDDTDGVFEDDLLAAESAAGLQVAPGDLLLVRTGYGKRRPSSGPDLPGLTADCLPFIHTRRPAVLGTDTGTDAFPSGYPSMPAPVHAVCIVAMGMWIIDNCDLEALAATCRRLGRWSFQVTVAPLRLEGATGCPVNPVAVF